MDGSHPPHLLGLLTDTPLWYRVLGFLWSVQYKPALLVPGISSWKQSCRCRRTRTLSMLIMCLPARRPAILDACHSRLKPWYTHGTWYLAHCHFVSLCVRSITNSSTDAAMLLSGMIMQLLAGANLIEVDFSLKDDRALFGGAQKRML